MKIRKTILALIAGLAATTIDAVPVLGATLYPEDARGIRIIPSSEFGDSPFLVDFLTIKKSINPRSFFLEDRTVIEFDLSQLSGPISSANLLTPLWNLDGGGDVGILDVYNFVGNGTISADDFFAGTLLTSFPLNGSETADIDITTTVQRAVNGKERFLGFRLSTNTPDRYLLGSIASLPLPTIVSQPVPEPSSVLGILGFSLLLTSSVLKHQQQKHRRATYTANG